MKKAVCIIACLFPFQLQAWGHSTAEKNMNILLKEGYTVSIPVPETMDSSKKPEITRNFVLKPSFSVLGEFNSLKLEARSPERPHYSDDQAREVLGQALNDTPPKNLKSENFAWGKLSSHCLPASGGGCAYLLQLHQPKQSIILRHIGSAPLVFNFKNIKVTKDPKSPLR